VVALRNFHFSLIRLFSSFSALACICWLAIGCAGYSQNKSASPSPSTNAVLSLSAASFDFQTVVVGQKSTQNLTLSNSGKDAVQVSAITLASDQFSVTGPSVPRTILPGNSLAYTVTFAPTTAADTTASLSISNSGSSHVATVPLKGHGEKAFANLAITPAVINFGNLALKTTSTQNITLQNTGDINLALQGVTVSGTGFGYADLSPGFSLAPNQKVTFQVWFSPKSAGPASGTLTLLSANLSSPGTVSLSGDGISSSTAPPPTPPTPPAAQHSVALNWGASPSQVIGYRVYRSETSGSSYSPLNGTAITALKFSDTTVTAGNTYYYVVTSVDSAGLESAYSNQVTAVIP
jgi:hypothetical protein